MEENTIKLRWIIIITALFLSAYLAICIRSNGETLQVLSGVVEKCDLLGGSGATPVSHATIKTETGGYIISSVSECGPGARVNIYIKRGALYFNTVYAAEKA